MIFIAVTPMNSTVLLSCDEIYHCFLWFLPILLIEVIKNAMFYINNDENSTFSIIFYTLQNAWDP